MTTSSAQSLLAQLLAERQSVSLFDVALADAALASFGDVWYVDSVNGNDGNAGTSLSAALKTIAAAVAAAAAGDTIFLTGSFDEEVTVSKAGLRLIGIGVSPKQCQWTAGTDETCLEITAESVLVQNIYFRPPVYATDADVAAIKLDGANYARILHCRFQGRTGSYNAIVSPTCNSDNVLIQNCQFMYMNTATYGAAIKCDEAGGLCYSAWQIIDCQFSSCVTCIDLAGRACEITGCTIAATGVNPAGSLAVILAMGIDLSGTNSGGNAVWGNQLGGAYTSTLYVVGASGDQWAGNFAALTGGVTEGDPA